MRCLALLLAVSGLASCKPRDAASDVKHDDNEPVRNRGAWQWLDVSEAEYFSAVVPYLSLPAAEDFVAPARDEGKPEHVLVERMQFWLDAVDQALRDRSRDDLAFVPKPKAIVVRDAEANAFVSPVPVCLDVPVRLNPEIPVTEAATLPFISYSTDGFLAPETRTDAPCVKRTLPPEYLKQVVAWFNGNNANCNVKLENDPATGTPTFFVGKTCPMDPELEDKALAKRAIVVTTADWVTINTGLIAQFPDQEWMIVPTLAHELGHYYRSHMTTFEKEYNFFYKLGDRNTSARPKADPALKARGERVVQSAKFLSLATVDGQKLMPSLFEAASSTVRRFCRRKTTPCKQSCKKLDDLMTSGKLADAVGTYPEGEVEASGVATYKRFEELFSQCSAKIKVATPAPDGGFTPQTVLAELRRAGFDQVFAPLPPGATLKEVYAGLQEREDDVRSDAETQLKNAEKDRLARYTVEQEADEFGLEQFVKLGFDPKAWIQADFVFNRTAEQDDQCEALYRNGWKDENGKPFLPDRGGFYEPHPNDCFRTYDIDREITAHGYAKLSLIPPAPGGAAWANLVTLAKSLAPDGGAESTPGHGPSANFPHFKVRSQ